MTDELDDLKNAFDAATPAPDGARKTENIALAEKNFADLQGSRDAARPTVQKGPIGATMNGVRNMWNILTTKGALTASTALVAVGLVVILPGDFLQQGDVNIEPPLPVTAEKQEAEISGQATSTEAPAESRIDETTVLADADSGRRDRNEVAEGLAQISPEPSMDTEVFAEPSLELAESDDFAAREQPSVALGTVADVIESNAPTAKRLIVEQEAIVLPESNTEEYANAPENPLKVTTDDPVSTFSIDVDTAAYSVVRQSLMSGHLPPKEAVRIEELINYFPYDYASPDGPHPFQPTITVAPTPWNDGTNLVHIGIQGTLPAVEDRPPLNLVFLIDTSGSMNQPNKLPLLKQSFRLMLSELRPKDEVSIVTYAGSAGQVLEPTKAAERSTILGALDHLSAGGSTAGQAGLQQAYQVAEGMADDGEVTRVILATDGDFNVGIHDPEALKDFIATKRETGTYLSVLGFGRGNLDDATMQALAQNGNGQASYIDTLSEARKVLVDQLTGALFPIANDVKIQVEFNPAQIAEYRLIGYETRALNREDFNNDKVDAGDIGAGHRVTAIYEVTPVGSDAVRNGPLRYGDAEVETDPSGELGFFKLRYKQPGASTSILIEEPIQMQLNETSDEQNFSIAIAGFGQLLKGGSYLNSWDWDDAIALANTSKGDDPFGYRAEAVTLMRLAQSLSK